MTRNAWPLAVAAGALTMALVGGVALAGFQPLATSDETLAGGPVAAVTSRDQPKDKLKGILDALVVKGTITQAQEDAILQAIKDTASSPKPLRPTAPNVRPFLGNLMKATIAYLGIDQKTLLGQLRGGKSVADVANGLSAQGKSAQGLIDRLTKTADDKVDAAVAANTLTADQAGTLKPKIAAEITFFVSRKLTKPLPPLRPRPIAPVPPWPKS